MVRSNEPKSAVPKPLSAYACKRVIASIWPSTFDLAGTQPATHATVLRETRSGHQARLGRAQERAMEMGAVRSGTALMGVA